MVKEHCRSLIYAPELVTWRYVRTCDLTPNLPFRVIESARWSATIREYDTDGAEIPEAIREAAKAIRGYPPYVLWPLDTEQITHD